MTLSHYHTIAMTIHHLLWVYPRKRPQKLVLLGLCVLAVMCLISFDGGSDHLELPDSWSGGYQSEEIFRLSSDLPAETASKFST